MPFRSAPIAAALCCLAPQSVAQPQPTWIGGTPAPNTYPHVVYDEARDRTVILTLLGTWELVDGRWQLSTTTGPKNAVFSGAAAYDFDRQVIVFFGNATQPETWEYDGLSWRLRPSATQPPPRTHTMRYDRANRQMILLSAQGGLPTETWSWDGGSWSKLAPTWSPQLGRGKLVYDTAQNRLLAIYDSRVSGSSGIWVWNGATWGHIDPTPPPFLGPLGWDEGRQRAVMFGNTFVCGPYGAICEAGETWEWDGATWSILGSFGAPGRRNDVGMTYDSARGRILYDVDDKTWTWNGTAWTFVAERSAPCVGHMAYDSARQEIVLHGGVRQSVVETWVWNGEWQRRVLPSGPPLFGPIDDAPGRGRVLLVEEFAMDVWEWDGSAWTRGSPSLTEPSSRDLTAGAFDDARGEFVLFGGFEGCCNRRVGDTWLWRDSWRQVTPTTAPSPRANHAMCYDPVRQRVVLFGGAQEVGGLANDTWEWDGNSWTQRSPVSSPLPMAAHEMTWDATAQRVVLFGGSTASGRVNDTWEWDGSDWTLRPPAPQMPPPLINHGLAHHAALQMLVAFDGHQRSNTCATWVFGSHVAGSKSVRGSGCAGSAGVPGIGVLGVPRLGARVLLDLVGGTAVSPAVAMISASPASLSLPGGCTLLVDPTVGAILPPFLTNAAGFASVPLSIPALAPLRGATLSVQAAVADPTGPLGLPWTSALDLTIGT